MDPTGTHWLPPAQMHHGNPEQNVPFILQLSDQNPYTGQETIQIASLEMREMETQTVPMWSDLLRMTIQNYLGHRLKPLLDTHVRGSNCVHLRGLTLEEILAIVVERHNALCVDKEVVAKKQTELVQISLEHFSETEAAAAAMIDLINSQDISQFSNSNEPGTAQDNDDWSTNSGTTPKKVTRKRPADSTKEELMRRGVKLIRCDPPEHIMQQAQNVWKNPSSGKRKHIPPKQWFMCADCGMKLRDISKLARHSALHSDLRLHNCQKCDKKYKSRDQLTKHVREVHYKVTKQFKIFCPYCGKGFHERRRREEHIAVHTGESLHKCQKCDKTFKSQKSLKMHFMTKHDTTNSLKCPLCDCIHATRYEVVKHLLRIHKAQVPQFVKGVLENKCLVCDMGFQNEQVLLQHVAQMHGTECDTCKRRARRQVVLTEEATRRGMNPDEAAGKTTGELEMWVKEDKKTEAAERAAKKAAADLVITKKAIDEGMDEEEAKDVTKARQWWYKKKQEKMQEEYTRAREMRREIDGESSRKAKAFLFKKRKQAEQMERRKREKRKYKLREGISDSDDNEGDQYISQVAELRAEVEQMKKMINQNAMEMALDIVEELEAKDVLGKDSMNQEMAVVKAELEVRSKRGNAQKSLAKKIVRLPSDEVGKDAISSVTLVEKKRATVTPSKSPLKSRNKYLSKYHSTSSLTTRSRSKSLSKSNSPKSRPSLDSKSRVEKGETAYAIQKDEKVTIKATGRAIVPSKVVSLIEQTSGVNVVVDPYTCIVYSQAPKATVDMIKKGLITYVFVRSDSAKIFATHMHSKPTLVTSAFSRKMFVNSIDPEDTKVKLLAGQLNMKIVPILLKAREDTLPKREDKTPTQSEESKLRANGKNAATCTPGTPRTRSKGSTGKAIVSPTPKGKCVNWPKPKQSLIGTQRKIILKVLPAKEKTLTRSMTKAAPESATAGGAETDIDAQAPNMDKDGEEEKTSTSDGVEKIDKGGESRPSESSSARENVACPEWQAGTSSETQMGTNPDFLVLISNSEPQTGTSANLHTGISPDQQTGASSELMSVSSCEPQTGTSTNLQTGISPDLQTGAGSDLMSVSSCEPQTGTSSNWQTGTSTEVPMDSSSPALQRVTSDELSTGSQHVIETAPESQTSTSPEIQSGTSPNQS